MGTRADFYVGIGKSAEWLGSIAYDGYRIAEMDEEHAPKSADNAACWAIKTASDEASFRQAVADLLKVNDDATLPEHGWPWPWDDSRTTDRAYCFVDGHTQNFAWGAPFEEGDEEPSAKADWPDMSARKAVTFGNRSGLLIISA